MALLLGVCGLLWLMQQNHTLRASLAQSRQLTPEEQNSAIAQLNAQLTASRELADSNEQAQVALRQQLESASAQAVQREQAITRLINEMTRFAAGTALSCLMLCAGCTSAPPAPLPVTVYNRCPQVSLCPMPASNPQTNGDLSADIRRQSALEQCALQVETVKHCRG